MSKLAWVLLPLLLAAAWLVVLAWRGALPPRPVMNVWFSLLLLVYLGTTASLGVFWVANQHLPVFDWHYVFGYATLLLLAVHLVFNLRAVWRHFARRPQAPDVSAGTGTPRARRPLLNAIGLALAMGGSFLLGLRHGRTELRVDGSGTAASTPLQAAELVERFHEFSAHSRRGVFRRAPSADWGDPPASFKAYAGLDAVPLPAPATARPGALDIGMLSALLWHTAAVNLVRGPIHFRTAPSSGALFATELYLVAREVTGLRPGLWHYDPQAHALRRLGDAPPDAAALGTTMRSSVLLLASAVLGRSGHKYRDRCYRYVLADLGHALENLRATAAALRVQAHFAKAFDESRAGTVLALDEAQESVLALVGLGKDGDAPAPWSWEPAPLATGTALGVTEAIHRATSLRMRSRATGELAAAAPRAARAAGVGDATQATALPAPRRHALNALEAIARRRSIRRYRDMPLPLDTLSALLDAALRRDAPVWSDAVRVDVITLAVDALPVAAWRYEPQRHALQRRRGDGAPLRGVARRAALDQDVVGDAAAVFVLSIDRASFVADVHGAARGYRHAFLEAGLIGERFYLEGGALGLGVCGVGAFYDDEAAALIGIDPAQEWVVHFVAVGMPA
jgi:SagB-type dehydrogenase family enzyme